MYAKPQDLVFPARGNGSYAILKNAHMWPVQAAVCLRWSKGGASRIAMVDTMYKVVFYILPFTG